MQISKYITFVPFANFSSWDVKTYGNSKLSFNFISVKLNSVLKPIKTEWVDIKDDELYPILGVKGQGKGLYINRVSKGSELTMKRYQKSKLFHLFYCKVRTVGGQWGVVYPQFENSFGSSNMQYLKIELDIIKPEFLELLLKVKKLTDEWDKNAIGADGRHFTLSTLLNLEIPLPTIEEQNRIVDNYNAKLQLAQQQEEHAKILEIEIERYLFEELGVEIKEKANKNKVFKLIKFSEIQRWDTLFLLGNLPNMNSSYRLTKFSEVIKYFNKGENGKTIRIDSLKFPKDDFHYIGMEHIEKETGNLLDMPEVKGKEIKSQTLRVPKGFFIYGKLRPYLNKYWINTTDFDNIICSSEFFVFDINDNLDKLFFKYILSSKIIQNQISDKTSGARMPRINEDIFFNLQFPLPPIEKQKQISNHINSIKSQIKELNALSAKNKDEAIVEFEKEIFN